MRYEVNEQKMKEGLEEYVKFQINKMENTLEEEFSNTKQYKMINGKVEAIHGAMGDFSNIMRAARHLPNVEEYYQVCSTIIHSYKNKMGENKK